MAEALEGRVAAILSESMVVINIGGNAGVSEGMVFAVIAEGGEVKDPATGETLGRWEVPKGHVRAVHVQPRLSTCEAFDPRGAEAQPADPSTNVLSAAMITASMRHGASQTLNVRRADIQGMPEIGPIQVGDRARALGGKP